MTKQLIKLCLASILSLSLNTELKAQEITPSIHATPEIVIAEDTLSEIESFIHEAQTNHPNVRISFSAQNGEIIFQKLPEKLPQNVESILESLHAQNWLDSLRSFKISNAIFDLNTSLLASTITKMTNLHSLNLKSTNLSLMDDAGFNAFANALSSKTNLQVLDFENNNLGKKFATLVPAIANMPNLQTLNLGSNHIDLMKADDFEALANALATKTKLQILDLSKNYFQEKFAILVPAIANMTNLHTLKLEYNYLESIGTDGMDALAIALSALTKLQILDLSGNQFQEKFTILAPAIANMPDLRTLILKENYLGARAAISLDALADALSVTTKLEELDLGNNGLGNALMPTHLKKLADTLHFLTKLQILDLGINDLGGRVALFIPAIANMTDLKTLILRENQLSLMKPASMEALANALSSKTNLETLNLICNGLKEHAFILAPAIANMTNLKNLSLAGNDLGKMRKDKFNIFADALSKLTKLQILLLNWNDLGSLDKDSFDTFINALPHLTKLQTLALSSNNLGEKLVSLAPTIAQMTGLKELHLACNNLWQIEPTSFAKLANDLSTLTELHELNLEATGLGEKLALLSPAIAKMINLQVLNLSQNFLVRMEPEGIKKFADALSALTKLRDLDLENNYLGDKFAILAPAFAAMPNLQNLGLSHNDLGNMGPDGWQTWITALSGTTNLHSLYLSNNRIEAPTIISLIEALSQAESIAGLPNLMNYNDSISFPKTTYGLKISFYKNVRNKDVGTKLIETLAAFNPNIVLEF